ncbi:MAG: hypothetical protein ACYDC2_10685 [Solirubrobacteraceae bacterium]
MSQQHAQSLEHIKSGKECIERFKRARAAGQSLPPELDALIPREVN